LVALQAFKDWSNYLLITTVASVGWIASSNVRFHSGALRSAALWCLGISIIFGILALAMVPLIAQQMTDRDTSIYRVPTESSLFSVRCRTYLPQACRPQHIAFMAGVLLFCLGTAGDAWLGAVVGGLAIAGGLFFRPRGGSGSRT
jgi:hypothetical protein